jgi:OMF family outer membrane factor
MNQYKEGILSTENLLLSFTDKVNAQLNLISATSSLQFVQSKIKINNTIQ